MLFNSIEFAIFLTFVFFGYWLIPHKYRWIVLLVANIYFYLSFDIKYLIILFINILLSYVLALSLEKIKNKFLLIISITLCLSTLLVCKYLNFSIQILSDIGIKFSNSTINLLLPIGISFYTFEIISYLVDVYKGKINAEKNFTYYAIYVSFFPTISSGPIERASTFIPQLKEEKIFKYEDGVYSLRLIAWGLFKKIVIADNLAVYVDTVYANVHDYIGFNFILISIFYTIQIYCDFSGYSDMARGTAKLLGFDINENFKTPYLSTSIKEYWSRWHISLTKWLTEYIYIPLGGNRKGTIRKYVNIIIVFFISGLWHGADYSFIVWGLMHAFLEIIEDIFNIKPYTKKNIFYWFRVIIVFSLVTIAWIFFRANTLEEALFVIKSMPEGITDLRTYFLIGIYSFNDTPKYVLCHFLLYTIPLLLFDVLNKDFDVLKELSKKSFIIRYSFYAILIVLILFFHNTGETNFIYFKF